MNWLNLRTGYSMKSVFGPLDEVLSHCGRHAGIADISTTYGHIRFREECKKQNVNPIYGIRIRVTDERPEGTRSKRYQNCEMTFIARTTKGLQEIYGLVDLAHKQFYQFPKITYKQLNDTSKNIVVLSGISPEVKKIKRKVFLSLSPNLPKAMIDCGLEAVACCDNYFPEANDKTQYETFTSDQWTMERKSTPMYILTDKEWLKIYPDHKEALTRRDELAKLCSGVELPIAPMVKYDVEDSADYLKRLCKAGIKSRGVSMNGTYKARLKRELKVIKEKDFSDYFLVVWDLVEYCKKIMPVGPARGSSAGSLVCYLVGITEVDPIPYGLIFERFIDINRTDLPDIDCDFENQELALKYLQKIYGSDCVAQLANINKLQPKSTLIRASKALSIHPLDVEEFKESIEDRPEGDDRSNKAILDSFDSKLGVDLLKQHPNLYHVHALEGHPSHLGIHAAGIIVCPQPLNRFCGINSRTTKHIAMIDKRDAEKINLLKIDALGLTTLSVLKDICLQLNIPFRKIYDIPLDNKKAYDLINSGNLPGIFQMEGSALQKLSKGMKVKNIEDLAALSALCRPGPLGSGAAELFVKQHSGKEAVKYLAKGKALKAITKNTLGNIVYQEQIMQIVREIGGMSWEDVIKVRKLMGKSQGDEAFGKYKDVFIQGATKSGMKEEDCVKLWDAMKNFGKYGFNKCISGNTKVRIANGNQHLSGDITIAELYERYENNPTASVKAQNRKPTLISFDGKKGIPQKSVEIVRNGTKKCSKYTFDDGSIVECTKGHKFLIDGEWKPIKKAVIGSTFLSLQKDEYKKKGPARNSKKYPFPNEGFLKGKNNPSYVNGKTKTINEFRKKKAGKPCDLCGLSHKRMEIHHRDFQGGLNKPKSLMWLCPSCHKKEHYANGRNKRWSKGYETTTKTLVKVEKIGMVDTYDIEMPVHHNFMLSNGLITHNSHAVAYAIITYLTAYFKANQPLEFAVAVLNNTSNDQTALKILRDLKERSGINYICDPENARSAWSVKKGKLIAGLVTYEGIAAKSAKVVHDYFRHGKACPPGTLAKVGPEARNIFHHLYPCKTVYQKYFKKKWGATPINKVKKAGEYVFVGMITKRDLKDMNDQEAVARRKGEKVKGPSAYVSMVFEDDTGTMNASISRFQFEEISKTVMEDTQVNKDWFVMYGKYVKDKYERFYIEDIKRITKVY